MKGVAAVFKEQVHAGPAHSTAHGCLPFHWGCRSQRIIDDTADGYAHFAQLALTFGTFTLLEFLLFLTQFRQAAHSLHGASYLGAMKVLRVACALLTAACFIVISGAAVEPIQNEVGRKVEESQREERKADGAPASREQGAEHRTVDFSPKPHSVVIEKKEEKRKNRKGKGNGRKRDPCLKKFKDYCFHGTCRYIRPLRKPSCLCQHGYHGERCHGLILPVENPTQSYDNTTTLAVVAVVLSTLCLVIIAALLLLRYQRRGGYDVESSEKTKLGIAAGNLCSHSER